MVAAMEKDPGRAAQWVQLLRGTLERLGVQIQPEWRVLDFGCGAGDMVRAFEAGGFKSSGADFEDELPAEGGLDCRAIEQPYRLPFQDAEFDIVTSAVVFEHVMDYDTAVREIRRVLKPGGHTLHLFPGRYEPLEPHVLVPGGTLIRNQLYLDIWARLGIRTRFQQGWDWKQTALDNHRYLVEQTTYPSDGSVLKAFRRYFSSVRFVEKEMADAKGGKSAMVARLPLGAWALREFRHRVIYAT